MLLMNFMFCLFSLFWLVVLRLLLRLVFWKFCWVMMLIILVIVLELYIVEVLFLSILMCFIVISGSVLRLMKVFDRLLVGKL